jgi:ATP-dependent DNA ligase
LRIGTIGRYGILGSIFLKSLRTQNSPGLPFAGSIERPGTTASPDELVRVAKEFGFEGIVAKRRDSFYESGKRTGAWVKYKVNRGQELVIGGYTPGNPFDALIVGYYEGERLMYAAKVRNGFVPQVRREVASRFQRLEIATCPFANLPERKRTQWALTKEEMKNCVWLKPELVAQVEFTEWTPDGHLRHSRFVGLKEDKNARDVVREIEPQL